MLPNHSIANRFRFDGLRFTPPRAQTAPAARLTDLVLGGVRR